MDFSKASACGSANGKVERRRRDAGTEPKRNVRRRTAGGKPADHSASGMPLVTNALFAEWSRHGREGEKGRPSAGGVKHKSALVTAKQYHQPIQPYRFVANSRVLGWPARNTRSENPRPLSNGSTVAVTSNTG